MTITDIVLKLIGAIFSPEFGEILGEIKEQRRRETSREVEAAKEKAQELHDTRDLQEELGKLSE